ncbi:MAG: uroporphyrinogen decarboxylase family protein, partial [bacterium]|nr:uroporphyrinogen decarboxylase family protein [bacterium]
FVWPYEMKLVQSLHALGTRVRLHICGKTHKYYKEMGQLGCEIVDLDWMNPMDQARIEMGSKQVLCGNIDPVQALKNSTPEAVYQAIQACHRATGPNYIVGAGCEVPRGTPPENLRAMIEYAQSHAPSALA